MALLMVATGLLFIGLGIPLARGRVKPNGTYGFRTPKTMSDPEIWYAANRVAGIDTIIYGVAITVSAVVAHLAMDGSPEAVSWPLGVMIVGLVPYVGHAFWRLAKL